MTISIRKAFKNIVKDKDFLPKYTVLIILSFGCGLLSFALLAKNQQVMVPSLIIAIIASCFALGYDIEYTKLLIKKDDADLPNWSKWAEYFGIGLKYIWAIILLGITILTAIIMFAAIGTLLTLKVKSHMAIVIHTSYALLIVIEILMAFCSIGFTYLFIESEYNILSLFNIKKLFGYISRNYFTALFGMAMLASINGVFATLTTAKIKYALLYIIPLMIAPFLRMISNNMIAQAYTANQNNEKSPLWKILLFGLTAIIMFVIIITVGFIGNHVIK